MRRTAESVFTAGTCPANQRFWKRVSVPGYEGGAKPPHSKTLARSSVARRYPEGKLIRQGSGGYTDSIGRDACITGLRRLSGWRLVRVLGSGLLAVIAFAAWFLYWAAVPSSLLHPPPLTTLFLDAKGRTLAELAGPAARSHRPVALAEMGPWLPEMAVALEDRRFFSHPGVDLMATVRALIRRHGGGSTITQQYVKIATGRRGRSIPAKLWEMALALQLERRWTKAQILEAYLNRAPYGNRLIGVEAAARGYFSKSAAELTQPEAAFLAGLPREPSRLNPWTHPGRSARRFEEVRRLLSGDPIAMSLPEVRRHLPENSAPHFVQAVLRHWGAALTPPMPPRGTVRCTLDLDLQRRAEQLVREHLDLMHRPDITQAALVVLDNETGAVRALVGSRDFKQSQINGALKFRNCGSTLKPFLYATGIDRRVFTAATLLPDTADAARDAYQDYDPHNFVLSHLGPVRVREALGNSLNVPAVVAVSRVGARTVFDAIGDWGIRFDTPLEKAGAGFILGNVGVRLLDLAAAFAGLARGGLAGPPRLLEGEPSPLKRVVCAEAAAIIADILCDNNARLQSFGPRSFLAFPVRIGAKTGTSAGFRDAWSAGFTRQHTVGVWVGNFDGRCMDHAASIASAAPLWRRMLDHLLLKDTPVPTPALSRTAVCSLTGRRPCAKSPGTVAELFLPGSEPRESAEAWFAEDGHPLLPEEYAGWCASMDNRLRATLRPQAMKLAILAPRDGAVFVLDDGLPAAQQQMEFQANLPQGVTWKVNGQPLIPSQNGRALWKLRPGHWTLEATNRTATASGRFEVRGGR